MVLFLVAPLEELEKIREMLEKENGGKGYCKRAWKGKEVDLKHHL